MLFDLQDGHPVGHRIPAAQDQAASEVLQPLQVGAARLEAPALFVCHDFRRDHLATLFRGYGAAVVEAGPVILRNRIGIHLGERLLKRHQPVVQAQARGIGDSHQLKKEKPVPSNAVHVVGEARTFRIRLGKYRNWHDKAIIVAKIDKRSKFYDYSPDGSRPV